MALLIRNKKGRTVFDIAKEIAEKYPESNIAISVVSDSEDEVVDDLIDFYFSQQMRLCSCGSPELIEEIVYKILLVRKEAHAVIQDSLDSTIRHHEKIENMKKEFFKYTDDNKDILDGLIEFVMKVLDYQDFLDHGSSIGGAWLTPKGHDLLYTLSIKMAKKEQD